jgi:hypothetical protein
LKRSFHNIVTRPVYCKLYISLSIYNFDYFYEILVFQLVEKYE